MVTLTVHLADDVSEAILREADARQVSATWMANKLIREALERLRPASEFQLTRHETPFRPPAVHVDQYGDGSPPTGG